MSFRNKPRTKRSLIYLTLSDEEFTQLVKNSNSVGQVLSFWNLENAGGNNHTVGRRIKNLGINTAHFNPKETNNKNKKVKPITEMLIENSKDCRGSVKRRLIKENLLELKCEQCGLETQWNNKPLVLRLDHRNGIHNDNRIENLRMLCPNCDSQQDTFAGRNKKYKIYSRELKVDNDTLNVEAQVRPLPLDPT